MRRWLFGDEDDEDEPSEANRREDERMEQLIQEKFPNLEESIARLKESRSAVLRPSDPAAGIEDIRKAAAERYFEEHEDAHVTLVGGVFSPFTGEVRGGSIFERQHNWPPHTVFDPESFPKGFLTWLKTEMKYNPEMREKR